MGKAAPDEIKEDILRHRRGRFREKEAAGTLTEEESAMGWDDERERERLRHHPREELREFLRKAETNATMAAERDAINARMARFSANHNTTQDALNMVRNIAKTWLGEPEEKMDPLARRHMMLGNLSLEGLTR
eukprot:2114080-Rhodomonas_salina.1